MTATTLPADLDALFVAALKESSAGLRGLALRMMGSPAEAEDVLQDAWLRAWRARGRLQAHGAMRGWMRQIVVRECLRALRWRALRRWTLWEPDAFESPDPERPADLRLIEDSRQRQLAKAIETLSPKQRMVFGLRFDEGWTVPEIAESCGMSTETVKTHLSRGVAAVQAKMESL